MIEARELSMRIREFAEKCAPLMPTASSVSEDGKPVFVTLSPDELLSVWLSTGNQEVCSCFYGWCFAKDIPIADLLSGVLWDAVCMASTGWSIAEYTARIEKEALEMEAERATHLTH